MTEPDFRLDRMSTKLADLVRERREKEDARKARYESSERAKKVRAKYESGRQGRSRTGYKSGREIARQNRPFIVWDGEQPRDTGYSLFGNSEGDEICHPHLGTKECLDLLIDTEIRTPEAIHVWFGGDFDTSWILDDLTWRQLGRLKHYNNTLWNGYEITHIPHKWFSVKYGPYMAKVFDVWSFFGSGLVPALEDWKIGPFATGRDASSEEPAVMPTLTAMQSMTEAEIIRVFKQLRGEFEWKDIEQQRIYMRLELKYTKMMCGQLRDTFLAAGYLPNSWHGPGALSRMAAKRHSVSSAMKKSPRPVQMASRFAYIGGRFTPHLVGHMQRTIYSYDVNSAYPYAATFLPNLARGKWRFENEPKMIRRALDENKFGVFNLTFDDANPYPMSDDRHFEHIRKTVWEMYPLPMRSPYHSGISYPHKVKGWYWTPEAQMIMDDARVTYHGCWVFDEDDATDKPLAWMAEYYDRRLLLKKMGNPAQYTFKTIINGWYGQCAQRVGWDKIKGEPPKSHQLEWAGYITSHCRAMQWEMVQRVGQDNVISIDTDGIMTLEPIEMKDGEVGDKLGQWKVETYKDGVFWQSGVYGLHDGEEWVKAKTRGIPKGKYKPESLVKLVHDNVDEFEIMQPRFIGYGLAFNSQYEKKNVWITEPQKYTFGGSGATVHRRRNCQTTCNGTIHRLRNNLAPDEFGRTPKDHDWKSAPHYLPWEKNTDEITEHMLEEDDWTYYFIGSDDV